MNKLIEIYQSKPLRLYKIDIESGKIKSGKKRDYANMETFLKYGIETFERYNLDLDYLNNPTGSRAKLCFLNESGKYQEIPTEIILSNVPCH